METVYTFSLTVSKFLITTGSSTGWNGDYITKSNIIDLSISGNYHCPDWIDYPIAVTGASGGLLGKTSIICGGGQPYTDKCYEVKADKIEPVTAMTTRRYYAASVEINSNTLWISGGFYGRTILSSSEFIQVNGSTKGPQLPIALSSHAMVNMRNELTMVIGGRLSE